MRWVATAAAAGPGTFVVWLTALAGFYVPMAASVMELSSRYPQEGGLYVWTREAFGDFSGFLSAWMYWMSNLPYFPSILYFGAGSILFAAGARGHALAASPTYFMTFAVVWLAIITVINILGLNAGKWLNNICSAGSWFSIVMLVALGVRLRHTLRTRHPFFRRRAHSAPVPEKRDLSLHHLLRLQRLRNRLLHGRRNRAIPVAPSPAPCSPAASCSPSATSQAPRRCSSPCPLTSVSGVDGFMRGTEALCAHLGFPWLLAAVMAVLLAMNAVGGAASYLSSTSRLPFVAGIHRYLPPVFGRIHPRFHTPWVAIGVYGVAGMVVAALGQAGTTVRGAYDALVSMSIVTTFLPFLFLFAAMARVQSRPAGARRPPRSRWTSRRASSWR